MHKWHPYIDSSVDPSKWADECQKV